MRGDLIRILGKLLRRKNRLDAIMIETTGLANPAPVIQVRASPHARARAGGRCCGCADGERIGVIEDALAGDGRAGDTGRCHCCRCKGGRECGSLTPPPLLPPHSPPPARPPAPPRQTFYVDEEIKEATRLDAVLTVVDAKHCMAHLDEVKPEGIVNEALVQARARSRAGLEEEGSGRAWGAGLRGAGDGRRKERETGRDCSAARPPAPSLTPASPPPPPPPPNPSKQVAFADRILLNKLDLVSVAEKEAVVARLRAINRTVEVIEATHSVVDLDRILGISAFSMEKCDR